MAPFKETILLDPGIRYLDGVTFTALTGRWVLPFFRNKATLVTTPTLADLISGFVRLAIRIELPAAAALAMRPESFHRLNAWHVWRGGRLTNIPSHA